MKTITKSVVVLLLSATFINGQTTQKWLQLGAGVSKNQTNQPSMTFDSDGNLFLAYTDLSTSQNKATLKKFDGQNWTTLSSQFTSGQAQFLKLVLDTAGIPYVAFQEPYPVTKKITVMKFNGSAWDTIGSRGFATADFGNPELSLIINPNNNSPILAFRENSSGKATVMGYFGTSWINIGGSNITQGNATKLSLSFQDTSLYLAFNNGAKNDKLSVLFNSVNGWVYSGDTVISNGTPDYIQCKQYSGNNGNYVAVAYKDLSDNKAYIKVKNNGSNTWTTLNNTSLSNGAANYVSLAKKHSGAFNDTLYCGYADATNGGNANVKKSHVSASTGFSNIGKLGFTDTLGVFAGAFYATLGIDKYDSLYMAVQSFNEYVVFKYRQKISLNPTSLSKKISHDAILIYPNPTSNDLTIKQDLNPSYALKLQSLEGKTLLQNNHITTDNYKLNLSEYPTGIYFIELKIGDTFITKKIVKH